MTPRRQPRPSAKPPSQFAALVRAMPPRAIMDDEEHDQTVEVIDRLMVAGRLTKGQSIYLETLVQSRHAVNTDDLDGLATPKHLMAEHAMTASDLGRLLGVHASMGSKILKGERSLTVDHIKRLAAEFNVSPEAFS